jgi:methylmalonyl-CoA mutase cobalamin-binding subunit
MAITALDTHQTVKDLTAAGFTDAQAEALAYALRQAQQIDLSNLATKADLIMTTSELRREMAEMKSELIKWGVGMAIGIVGATVALLRLLPGGHP